MFACICSEVDIAAASEAEGHRFESCQMHFFCLSIILLHNYYRYVTISLKKQLIFFFASVIM